MKNKNIMKEINLNELINWLESQELSNKSDDLSSDLINGQGYDYRDFDRQVKSIIMGLHYWSSSEILSFLREVRDLLSGVTDKSIYKIGLNKKHSICATFYDRNCIGSWVTGNLDEIMHEILIDSYLT